MQCWKNGGFDQRNSNGKCSVKTSCRSRQQPEQSATHHMFEAQTVTLCLQRVEHADIFFLLVLASGSANQTTGQRSHLEATAT